MNNKVVLITGSSIGIGRETAFEFAKAGAAVVLTYKNSQDEAEHTLHKCRELGAADTLLIHLDLLKNQSIKDCISEVIGKFGKISYLINNAGISNWKYFRDQTFDDFENEIGINLEGLIKITYTAIDHVDEGIINISSLLGVEVEEKETVYCATKWGVRGFTGALALEYPNLKITSVNPRGTATAMNDFEGDDPAAVAGLILKLVSGEIKLESGKDLNTWDYL